jgi:hypothetical protein
MKAIAGTVLAATLGAGCALGPDLELRSEDGTMEWNLKPSQTDSVIAGPGEFIQFLDPQW